MSTAERPNILLIMTDQQRWDSLSCYGCEAIDTPNLDRLAREGARYEHCYAGNPICTPSRASLMTGKPVPTHGVERLYDILSEDQDLFPVRLQELGYRTALFGKLHVSATKFEADNRKQNDGFDVYEWCSEPSLMLEHPTQAYGRWLEKNHPEFYKRIFEERRFIAEVPEECHMTHWAAQRTIDFIKERKEGTPFFCNMSVFDPHNPYHDYPRSVLGSLHQEKIPAPIRDNIPMDEMPEAIQREHAHGYMMAGLVKAPNWSGGDKEEEDTVDTESFYAPDAILKDRIGYLASIALIDKEVGRILDTLDEEGIADNTLVIFCSDHGDMLGDHGLLAKGAYFYDPCVRVPLLMRWPSKVQPETVTENQVQLYDLTATILSAAGADADSVTSSMPDSRDLLNGEKREYVVSVYHGTGICDKGGYFDPPIYGAMIRDDRYKLTVYFDAGGPEQKTEGQLFDMSKDPTEIQNLWGLAEFTEIQSVLTQKLREWYNVHAACASEPLELTESSGA